MNELSNTTEKVITDELINKIITSLNVNDSIERQAHYFWFDNKEALIGLAVSQVIHLISISKDRKALQDRYNELINSMNWDEKIEFLRSGIEELKRSDSAEIREATFVFELVQILPKVLPIILAAI